MSSSSPTLIVIDGNSLLHRAWHGYPSGTTNSQGQEIAACRGFLSLLCGVLDKIDNDAVIVGFDDAGQSWRREAWPAYKATRGAKDPSLVAQLALLPDILSSLGVKVVTPTAGEADDVLGAGARLGVSQGWQVVLVTSDRDAMSLVAPGVQLLRLKDGLDNAELLDEKAVESLFGITPGQYRDFAAVRGDSSDNLPGVDGLGPKNAAALVQAASSAEHALHAAAADPLIWTGAIGRARSQRLADPEQVQRVQRNLELMRIADHLAELDGVKLDDIRGVYAPERIHNALVPFSLDSLSTRLAIALAGRRRNVRGVPVERSDVGGSVGAGQSRPSSVTLRAEPISIPALAHDVCRPERPTWPATPIGR